MELFSSITGSLSLRLIRAAGGGDEIIETAVYNEPETRFVLAARCAQMELSFFYGKDQYSLKSFKSRLDAKILSTEYAGGFVGVLAGAFASGNGKDIDNYADVLWAEYKGLQ